MLCSSGVNASAELEEAGLVPFGGIGDDLGEHVQQPFLLFREINNGGNGHRHFGAPEE